METKPVEIKIVLLSVGFILAIDYGLNVLCPDRMVGPMTLLGCIRILQTACIVALIWFWGGGPAAIGLDRGTLKKGFYRGIIWTGGFGVVAALGMGVIFLFGTNPLKLFRGNLPNQHMDLVVYLIVGGIIAPVSEEIFFRGIVYGFFRKYGMILAIIATTTFFVVMHSFGRGVPVTQIVGGIVFAISYEIEKSLIVPLMIHITGNLAIFSLCLLSGYIG